MCNTTLNKEIQKKYFVKYALNNLLLATNLNLVIPITLQSDGINLWYLKLWLVDLTEFLDKNIKGLLPTSGCKDIVIVLRELKSLLKRWLKQI